MRRGAKRLACLICLALVSPAPARCAHAYRVDGLRIDHPLARATPPGARTGVVFLTVDNGGIESDRLVSATTPIAVGVAIHQMTLDGGVMRMRAVPSVEVPPGGRLELKPDGYHLMLLDLKQALKVGERFPLRLTFARVGSVFVWVWVEDMGATPSGPR